MNQRTRLDGQVAFVTGGGGGIGHGIALGLAEADARVAVFEIFPERAEETAAEIRALGGEALALPGDAMSGAALKQAIAATDAQCESAQTGGDDDRHHPADRRRADLVLKPVRRPACRWCGCVRCFWLRTGIDLRGAGPPRGLTWWWRCRRRMSPGR